MSRAPRPEPSISLSLCPRPLRREIVVLFGLTPLSQCIAVNTTQCPDEAVAPLRRLQASILSPCHRCGRRRAAVNLQPRARPPALVGLLAADAPLASRTTRS